MENHYDVGALVRRLELLERRQRLWARIALALAAVAVLGFAGWAPFDDLRVNPTPARTVDGKDTAKPKEPPLTIADENPEQPKVPPADESGFAPYAHREGDETFLPSRLEWISLRASAELPRGGTKDDGYGIMYGPDGRGSNTIRVLCNFDSKRVTRERMEKDLKYAQKQLEGLAKVHGWTWMKIRVETRQVN